MKFDLKKKYKSIPLAVKAGIWFTICNILQRGIQFLTTPFYTRLLTTDEYGMYSVFTTWLNVFMVFATLNLSSGPYYNGMLKFEKNKCEYTSSIQFMGSLFTIGFVVVLCVLYPLLENYIGIPLFEIILMAFVMFFQPAFLFWSGQQRIDYKYRLLIVITVIVSALSPVIGILFVSYCQMGYVGVILGYVISNTAVGVVFYIYNFIRGHTFYQKAYWKYSLSLSLPLIPHYLSQMILGQSDRVMIKYYCGASDAGIYSLAYQVSLIMNLLITGINNSLNPWLYRGLKNREYGKIKKITTELIVGVAVLSGIAMLIAPEIVMILGPQEYMGAVRIIPPVMLSTWITFCYCIWGTALFYFECTKLVAVATSSGAVINLVLNVLFIPQFGFIVAAYTTLIGYIVISIFYWLFTRKVLRENNLKINDVFNIKLTWCVWVALSIATGICRISYNCGFVFRYTIFVMVCLIVVFFRNKIISLIKSLKRDV